MNKESLFDECNIDKLYMVEIKSVYSKPVVMQLVHTHIFSCFTKEFGLSNINSNAIITDLSLIDHIYELDGYSVSHCNVCGLYYHTKDEYCICEECSKINLELNRHKVCEDVYAFNNKLEYQKLSKLLKFNINTSSDKGLIVKFVHSAQTDERQTYFKVVDKEDMQNAFI